MSILHSIVFRSLNAKKQSYDPKFPKDYPTARLKEIEDNKRAVAPKSVNIKTMKWNGVEVEELSNTINPKDKIIFYIHGGAFIVGSVKTRRAFTGYIVSKLGYNVLAVEYRLAPEHPFPAAPTDCFSAYRELLNSYDPKNIVIMGESAGGNLVLSTLLQIKNQGLPQPAAAICIAPCVQFDKTLPSYTKNASTDAMVTNLTEEVLDTYLQSRDLKLAKNPLFAPYYGDFTGCPPIYLWASESEILLDDSVILYEKLKKAGHPFNLYLRKKMMHTWMIVPYFSESKKDLSRMKTHLQDIYNGVFNEENQPIHLK